MKFIKLLLFYVGIVFILFVTVLVGLSSISSFPFGLKMIPLESDSMIPAITPGSMIIIHEEPWYQKDDIITFWAKVNEKETMVTHRIIKLGGNVYVTKGDSNLYEDSFDVLPRFVIGRNVLSIPFLGSILKFFRSKIGLALFMIPVVLIVYNQILIIKKIIFEKN